MTQTAFEHLSLILFVTIFFHSSEYLLAIAFHGRRNVTRESLLITKGYLLDITISLVEYLIEARFFPRVKDHRWISYAGLAMVVAGEIVRKIAIVTAGAAFTHAIRTDRDERHKLVTHGVYSFMRHPGYLGFLVWSIGTQIMLCNPVSTVWFGAVVWWFFYDRIAREERYLREFFGSRYVEYAKLVPSGLPFIK